jgi:hypothetical protein
VDDRRAGGRCGRHRGPMGAARTSQTAPNGRVGPAGGQDGRGQRGGGDGRRRHNDRPKEQRRGRLQHLRNLDGEIESQWGEEHRSLVGSAQQLGSRFLWPGHGRGQRCRRRLSSRRKRRQRPGVSRQLQHGRHGDVDGSPGAAASPRRRRTTPLHTTRRAGERALGGGRIWSRQPERTPEQGDQAGGAAASPLDAMVARGSGWAEPCEEDISWKIFRHHLRGENPIMKAKRCI